MKKIFAILLPLLAALLAMSCNNGPDNIVGFEASTAVFSGKVMGAGGGPMAGVGVHYIFDFDPASSVAPLSKSTPTTLIDFELPGDGDVTLNILRYGSRKYIATLLHNEPMSAGQNEVEFDPSKLTNGLYVLQIIAGNYTHESIMALRNTDIGSLIRTEPLAVTDAEGNFTIPYSWLGIGRKLTVGFDGINLYNVRISDRIGVVLYKPGYRAVAGTVILNPGSSTYGELHMQ